MCVVDRKAGECVVEGGIIYRYGKSAARCITVQKVERTWTLTVIVAIIAKQQQPAKDLSLLYAVEPIPVFLY